MSQHSFIDTLRSFPRKENVSLMCRFNRLSHYPHSLYSISAVKFWKVLSYTTDFIILWPKLFVFVIKHIAKTVSNVKWNSIFIFSTLKYYKSFWCKRSGYKCCSFVKATIKHLEKDILCKWEINFKILLECAIMVWILDCYDDGAASLIRKNKEERRTEQEVKVYFQNSKPNQ